MASAMNRKTVACCRWTGLVLLAVVLTASPSLAQPVGRVLAIGSNNGGQLGIGTTNTPQAVLIDDVSVVAAGFWHTLAPRV